MIISCSLKVSCGRADGPLSGARAEGVAGGEVDSPAVPAGPVHRHPVPHVAEQQAGVGVRGSGCAAQVTEDVGVVVVLAVRAAVAHTAVQAGALIVQRYVPSGGGEIVVEGAACDGQSGDAHVGVLR